LEEAADCVVVAPDGKRFATWYNSDIKVWDSQSLEMLRHIDSPNHIACSLAFTTDGDRLIAVDREVATVWELAPSPLPPLILGAISVGLLGVWFGMNLPLRKPVTDSTTPGGVETLSSP
jgi:hypothetical protein